MAIRAVAVVRAGPEIARQSNCMPVLVPYESKGHNVTISCDREGFSCSILKKRLTEPARLSDFLDQMISIAAEGTGLHAYLFALRFRNDIHASHFAVGLAGPDADRGRRVFYFSQMVVTVPHVIASQRVARMRAR
jgi:hypothetical protein